MDGILNVRKPKGLTSFDVVRRIKRAAHEKRVGHSGTLDPMAEGVLPVFLGRATRLIEYLDDTAKVYRAALRFGIVTDTYDAEGAVVEERDASHLTLATIEDVLSSFRGPILQVPPMYSALHHEGQRLYDLARAGIEVARAARPVIIHRLDVIAWDPPRLTVDITCSKGTYIRSLAHDLGQAMGCGAHLETLERTRSGPFSIEDSYDLETVEGAFRKGVDAVPLLPIDHLLSAWPDIQLNAEEERAIRQGKGISCPFPLLSKAEPLPDPLFWPQSFDHARMYTPSGHFLAVAQWDEDAALWRPRKVFH